jgi:regulator of RNase E activity RraA
VDFGSDVEILGLKVRSGDLLMADCHGVICIPIEVIDELAAVAARMHAERRRIVDLCLSPDFNTEKLQHTLKNDGQ